MKAVALAAAMLSLAACDRGQDAAAPPDLETVAIARGLVRDPDNVDPVGLYDRDTDRLCVVAADGGYRVGAQVDYGAGHSCSAAGRAERAGTTLRIDLGEECAFDGRIEGERIVFPATLPDGCRRHCSGRASLAALSVERLSGSTSEAAAMRDAAGRHPCADN